MQQSTNQPLTVLL